jgi:thiol-disulfide isomerase/thioredoxin
MASEGTLKLTDWKTKADFLATVNSPGPHVFVFSAKWCGFCARFLSEASSFDSPVNTELFLINADDPDESLWDDYSIKFVPTIVVMEDGKQVFRRDGKPMAGLSLNDLQQALEPIK